MKKFPWRIGMHAKGYGGVNYYVIRNELNGDVIVATSDYLSFGPQDVADMVPVDCGATRGAFLDVVREAFKEPTLHVQPDAGKWVVARADGHDGVECLCTDGGWGWISHRLRIEGSTELAVLLAAWEIAP